MITEEIILPGVRIAGGAAISIALIGFVRWAIGFAFGRFDMREDRVDQREKAMEERINARLSIVEAELGIYREATMVLVEALANKDPGNPALLRVSHLLRSAIPLPKSPDAGLDGLIDKLRGAP